MLAQGSRILTGWVFSSCHSAGPEFTKQIQKAEGRETDMKTENRPESYDR